MSPKLRIVIQSGRRGYRFLMQQRWLRFFWRTRSTSAHYADFMDCLLELGRACTKATVAATGVHVRRKARRQFGRLAGRLVMR